LIVPLAEVERSADGGFLRIGGPGVDGISFGYRKEHGGVWAYYPGSDEYRCLGGAIGEVVARWYAGTITV